MRTQYCRQHIKKAAEECDLGSDIVDECERVDKFCGAHAAFADCATRPVYRLISIQDVDVRNKAISFAENALNEETPTGGKVKTRLTEPEIIGIIRKANRAVHGEPASKGAPKEKEKTQPVPDPATPPVIEADRERKARLNPPEETPVQLAPAQESVIGGCRTLKEAEEGAPVPIVTAPQPLEPKKDKHYYAAELLKLLPDSTKQEVSALLKEHTSWKTVDAFYFGVKALAEPKQPTTTKKV
jgi:hypothetical protein